jgi:hypothetical protein
MSPAEKQEDELRMPESNDSHTPVEPRVSRPDFTPDYGILDAASGAGLLPWSWVAERMAGARNYWIGSSRPDGRPHAAPVWGVWVDETFYFSTDPRSRKGRNLGANPQVVVHLESGDEAVILEGVVEEVRDSPELARFVDAYDEKYHIRPDTMEWAVIYALRPQVAYAWRERDFSESATRWQFSSGG